jgi:hypothetical protein
MSQRLNHDKVNMQKRIARESTLYDYDPARATSDDEDYHSGPEKWLPMRIGKHKGKTLPQIVFKDPSYVVWLYQNDVLLPEIYKNEYQYHIAHQLEVIHNRMTRIKPPTGCKFAIVIDDASVFRKFIALRKGQSPKKPLKSGWKIVQRLDLLDIGILSRFKNPKRGFERMCRCLTKYCFGDADAEIDAKACEKFIEDDAKFDLRGIKSNKWLELGPDDRAALDERYKRLVILRSVKTIKKYLK